VTAWNAWSWAAHVRPPRPDASRTPRPRQARAHPARRAWPARGSRPSAARGSRAARLEAGSQVLPQAHHAGPDACLDRAQGLAEPRRDRGMAQPGEVSDLDRLPLLRRGGRQRAADEPGRSAAPLISSGSASEDGSVAAEPPNAPARHPYAGDGSLSCGRVAVSIRGHWREVAAALPRGVPCVQPVYRPRDAEHTVLHQVISEHLGTFLRAAAEAGAGAVCRHSSSGSSGSS
jgi:hypothetical protein